jgi:hypothetical protein
MANKKTPEELENERTEEKARLEAEYKAKMEENQKLLMQAETEKAKLQGAMETMKQMASQQTQGNTQQAAWTDDQWASWEEKTGMKREQLVILDNIAKTHTESTRKEFEEKVKQAEERARLAEGRITEFEKSRTYDSYKTSYFKTKPAFARYEKDFDEFIKDFPEDVKKDPTRLNSLFEKAETYIKGKVGEKAMRDTKGGSTRFDRGDEEDATTTEDVDLSDMRPHERMTVEKLIRGKEENDSLKKYRHDLKGDAGIMINAKDEWDKFNKK